MSADDQNATTYIGDDCLLQFAITAESGAALDITGYTGTWLATPFAGLPALVTKTTANGISITAPTQGIVQVALTHADTAKLSGDLWHQLVLTDPSGTVTTVSTGILSVKLRT